MKLITTIKSDGTIDQILEKKDSLEILQKRVGGYIEIIPLFNKYNGKNCIAYCNEYGIYAKLQFNKLATDKWKECLGNQKLGYEPQLVGDVVIVQSAVEKTITPEINIDTTQKTAAPIKF